MRSDAAAYELTAPPSLQAVLTRLAEEPGRHAVLAGGTELMVALNTGRLAQRSLLSIQHLRELRFIRAEQDAIYLGAGTTFTDIRRHEAIG
ncbi:MAG TPA: FAD binding domain-containing protein, partial [Acidobacteriaceae bacterium]|nr:FAD binding domain-containing protein [Acidobacteriaceae bacterium]